MTYNASDRKQIRAKEKDAARAERSRIEYTHRIMSDLSGREWMHGLLESCYLFSEPFVRGGADATAHNLGRQSVGKQIFLDIVTHCPTEYILMMREANIKELTDDRRNDDTRSPGPELLGSEDPGRDVEGREPGDYDPYRTED